MSKINQYQSENLVPVWDRIADRYDYKDFEGPDDKANLQVLIECTGDPRNKTYCEVGSGSGTTSAKLASLGANVTLIDSSPKALSSAKRRFKMLHLKGNYCLMDALNLGLSAESFDVVWNGGVIEHFYDSGKIKLIREMWRMVKPGGALFIQVPNQFDLPFVLSKFVAERRGSWPFGFEDDLTPNRLERLSHQAGLNCPSIFSYNPVVGWWFIPFGKQITQKMGLNTPRQHAKRSRFGHVVCMTAYKPE